MVHGLDTSKSWLIVGALALFLAACGDPSAQTQSRSAPSDSIAGDWRIEKLVVEGESVEVSGDGEINIADDRLFANFECELFLVVLERVDGGGLSVAEPDRDGTCSDSEFIDSYVAGLKAVEQWEITGMQLRFYGPSTEVIFTPKELPPLRTPDVRLLGSWQIEGLEVDGAPIIYPEGYDWSELNVGIGHGNVGASAGCNGIGWSANFSDDGQIEFGDGSMSAMSCGDELDRLDDTVFTAIDTATSWVFDGETLTLEGPNSRVELSFVAGTGPTALESPIWVLVSINDGTSERAIVVDDVHGPVAMGLGDGGAGVATPGCEANVFVEIQGDQKGSITHSPDPDNQNPDCYRDDLVTVAELLAEADEFEIIDDELIVRSSSGMSVTFQTM